MILDAFNVIWIPQPNHPSEDLDSERDLVGLNQVCDVCFGSSHLPSLFLLSCPSSFSPALLLLLLSCDRCLRALTLDSYASYVRTYGYVTYGVLPYIRTYYTRPQPRSCLFKYVRTIRSNLYGVYKRELTVANLSTSATGERRSTTRKSNQKIGNISAAAPSLVTCYKGGAF